METAESVGFSIPVIIGGAVDKLMLKAVSQRK